ncbi:MAG: hypothetical protein FWD17_17455 [Polyangiaceae bacterium]|nr:hypothetical protein [Polyangiaceae bacterium]
MVQALSGQPDTPAVPDALDDEHESTLAGGIHIDLRLWRALADALEAYRKADVTQMHDDLDPRLDQRLGERLRAVGDRAYDVVCAAEQLVRAYYAARERAWIPNDLCLAVEIARDALDRLKASVEAAASNAPWALRELAHGAVPADWTPDLTPQHVGSLYACFEQVARGVRRGIRGLDAPSPWDRAKID